MIDFAKKLERRIMTFWRKEESKLEVLLLSSLLMGIVIISVVVFFAAEHDSHRIKKMTYKCENVGGELLEHTRRVGKFSHSNWICVKSDIILNY